MNATVIISIVWFLFRVLGLLLSIFLFLAVVSVAVQGLLNLIGGENALPFVPTPRRIVRQMIEIAEIKNGQKVVDLGSGIGSIVIPLARKYDVLAIGVERSPFLWALSKLLSLFAVKKGRVSFKLMDMRRFELSDVDVVFLFVTTAFMNRFLKDKLERGLKKGSKIVSYAFELESKKFKSTKFPACASGIGKFIYLYEKL